MAKKEVVVGMNTGALKEKIVANLFKMYEVAAADCMKNGCVQVSKKTGYEQMRPQYHVMNEMLDRLISVVPEFKELKKPETRGRKPVDKKADEFETD